MLILDNIIYSLQKRGGISNYWFELGRGIEDSGLDFAALDGRRQVFSLEKVTYTNRTVVSRRSLLPVTLDRYVGPLNLSSQPEDIFHTSYYRSPLRGRCKTVVTVYDFTYEKYRSGLPAVVHCYQKRRSIESADAIICISHSTKRDLEEFFPRLGDKLVRVIYLASSAGFYSNARWRPDWTRESKKTLAFVGGRAGYKNFDIAIAVLARLPEAYQLLVVGGGELSAEERSKLEAIKGRYSHEIRVSDSGLNAILNGSFALLYLTQYEGFGLPVIEAMQAGCPVICRGVSSIPEVYGEVGNILPADADVDEICDAILALEDDTYRDRIISAGYANAVRFSWSNTVDQTLELYRDLL